MESRKNSATGTGKENLIGMLGFDDGEPVCEYSVCAARKELPRAMTLIF